MRNPSPNYDVIFLDRDGTLNPDPGYIATIGDFKLYPFTMDALKKLSTFSNHLVIITNQSGVSRGLIDPKELDKIHNQFIKNCEQSNVTISGLYVCTDLPGKGSTRRKPESGMFLEAASDLAINLNRCLMIGDSVSDMQAGIRLNMDTMLVLTGRGLETQKKLSKEFSVTYTVGNLLEGAHLLINEI